MDIRKAQDSLTSRGSEHDPIFYSSDEFMVELLSSPGRRESEEHQQHFADTNKALETIKAPLSPPLTDKEDLMKKLNSSANNTPKKPINRRDQFEKAHSFSSRFSDGVIVKPKTPTRERRKSEMVTPHSFSPVFKKKKSKSSRRTQSRSLNARSVNLMISPNSKIWKLDVSPQSDGDTSSAAFENLELSPTQSLPSRLSLVDSKCWVSSGSEWSDDLESSSHEQSTPKQELHKVLQQPSLMSAVSEDQDDENALAPPPPPPPPMTSASPRPSVMKSYRMSASARLEHTEGDDEVSALSTSWSSRTRSMSFRLAAASPKTKNRKHASGSSRQLGKSSSPSKSPESRPAPRQGSSWIVSSPVGSSRGSSKSKRGRKSHLFGSMPMVPHLDGEEKNKKKSKSPKRREPPLFRPLDKTLMREYPSTTTATTFLTADTDAVDYSMTHMFPMTKETERILFKKVKDKRDLTIERTDGEKIGLIDFSMVNQGKRLIKDACGRTCAVIFLSNDRLGGKYLFKICGNKPASRTQRLSNETGYYTWAEVKNSGSLGGKFIMNRFDAETSSCCSEHHYTKPYGSLFSRGKSKGYSFYDENKKECAKMCSLKKGRGIVIGPNRDMCLFLAFAAIVDEMVENRMR